MAKSVFFFGDGHPEGDPKRRDLLGGKGAGPRRDDVARPARAAGLHDRDRASATPSQRSQSMPDEARAEVAAALARLEKSMGARLGDAAAPLLVSVRSGARASMPGMMDTILNLGLNDAVAEGLAARTKSPRFAFDAYRRFVAMHATHRARASRRSPSSTRSTRRAPAWRDAKGVDRDAPQRRGAEARASPTRTSRPRSCKALVRAFKAIVKKETGKDFPSDPREQLWQAIEAVFKSWNNHRAIVYRRMHDIPDDWGTACNVQAMVFGNLGDTSATGVAFTRDPSTGEKKLYGEWLPNAQGEDVVAGIRTPLPHPGRGPRAPTSRSRRRCPRPTASSSRIATTLEKHFRDMQDLEFTIQDGKLYMLQCRTGEARGARGRARRRRDGERGAHHAAKRPCCASTRRRSTSSFTRRSIPKAPKKLLARGLAASPGAASGHIVFSADEAERRAGQGKPVILVRVETSPEDIHGMKAARGILTARGGMTSHAAVVARGMGKPCVAGVSAVAVNYETQTMTVTVYDDAGLPTENVTLKKGDIITIDGGSGHVYEGAVPTVSAALSRRVRRAHVVGRRGAHDEGPRQRRHAARRAHGARVRRRGHRPLPHRAHVLRGGAHRRRCAR